MSGDIFAREPSSYWRLLRIPSVEGQFKLLGLEDREMAGGSVKTMGSGCLGGLFGAILGVVMGGFVGTVNGARFCRIRGPLSSLNCNL